MAVHQNIARTWLQSDIEAVQLIASRYWESIERNRMVRLLADSEERLRLAVSAGRLSVWEPDLVTPQFKANHGQKSGSVFS